MRNFWRLYRRHRSAVAGTIILALVVILAATAHLLYPGDPFRIAGPSMQPPGAGGFLLGSDSLGRDVAAGIAHGAKTSLLIGLLATIVAVGVGTVFGGLAGYCHGGKSALGAVSHHVPEVEGEKNLLLVAGPHIGYHAGQWGKVPRPGQPDITTCWPFDSK